MMFDGWLLFLILKKGLSNEEALDEFLSRQWQNYIMNKKIGLVSLGANIKITRGSTYAV